MDFLNWYDWITPTTPIASLFFGIIFTVMLGLTVWFNTKNIKTTKIAFATGFSVVIIGVIILNSIGYYV